MNEVNAKFYVLLDSENMLFLEDSKFGYTSSVLSAEHFPSKEAAEGAKSYCYNKDKISVKEVKVIVSNMP